MTWILDLVACPQPGCHGRLRARGLTARCVVCKTIYPVLAGVPVVVPAPAHWMAAHRDAVLATLVDHDAADRPARDVVDAFAGAARDATPAPFSDDWAEGEIFALPFPPRPHLGEVIVELVGKSPGTVLDLGCGDGAIAALLAPRARRLAVADRSLRAVLRARERTGAAAVVVDAEQLSLRGVDTLVAANLIDLLDDPHDFLTVARAALSRRGRLVLATPEPSLGTADDDAILGALRRARLAPRDVRDPVPWPRVHHPRRAQLDACWVAVCGKIGA
jgi:SAM-dependent methyltransferase